MVERLEDSRLASLILADETGDVIDEDVSGIDDIPKHGDSEGLEAHFVGHALVTFTFWFICRVRMNRIAYITPFGFLTH